MGRTKTNRLTSFNCLCFTVNTIANLKGKKPMKTNAIFETFMDKKCILMHGKRVLLCALHWTIVKSCLIVKTLRNFKTACILSFPIKHVTKYSYQNKI